eukprot:4245844-Prymnesium_polylepis.1
MWHALLLQDAPLSSQMGSWTATGNQPAVKEASDIKGGKANAVPVQPMLHNTEERRVLCNRAWRARVNR